MPLCASERGWGEVYRTHVKIAKNVKHPREFWLNQAERVPSVGSLGEGY
jgi:hypothetical protein